MYITHTHTQAHTHTHRQTSTHTYTHTLTHICIHNRCTRRRFEGAKHKRTRDYESADDYDDDVDLMNMLGIGVLAHFLG
jgi:hypothetical protein